MKQGIAVAAVDWLTVTTRYPEAAPYLMDVGGILLLEAEKNGDLKEKAAYQGYHGYSAGAVFWGLRKDGAMLRVSGAEAAPVGPLLDWGLVKATRIDVQVTYRFAEDQQMLAHQLMEVVKRRKKAGRKDLPPSPELKDRLDEGHELKIGKRSSMRYGRLYDKWRETKDHGYTNCWRYEVEYKRECAPEMVRRLQESCWSAEAVTSAVAAQYARWNLPTPFSAHSPVIGGSVGRREFDAQRLLRWLSTQVGPAVQRLKEAGFEDEARAALALPAA